MECYHLNQEKITFEHLPFRSSTCALARVFRRFCIFLALKPIKNSEFIWFHGIYGYMPLLNEEKCGETLYKANLYESMECNGIFPFESRNKWNFPIWKNLDIAEVWLGYGERNDGLEMARIV
jgi:hypothetical protein